MFGAESNAPVDSKAGEPTRPCTCGINCFGAENGTSVKSSTSEPSRPSCAATFYKFGSPKMKLLPTHLRLLLALEHHSLAPRPFPFQREAHYLSFTIHIISPGSINTNTYHTIRYLYKLCIFIHVVDWYVLRMLAFLLFFTLIYVIYEGGEVSLWLPTANSLVTFYCSCKRCIHSSHNLISCYVWNNWISFSAS